MSASVKRHQNQLHIRRWRRTTQIPELQASFKPTQPQVDTNVTKTNSEPRYLAQIHRPPQPEAH